ncbi:hypothetical protein ACFX2J_018800 [Malus domestica]
MRFVEGEAWKKVFGPVFVYLNSVPTLNETILWENANEQLAEEVNSWPYNFTQSENFPSSSGRGSVAGQLLVQDWYFPLLTLVDPRNYKAYVARRPNIF